jgi:acetoin utilization deacetylase AcuC-like enzyme
MVHTAGYYDLLAEKVPGKNGRLDPDTFFSTGTWDAALLAAGGVMDLAVDTWRGADGLTGGLALVRPPGHHAEADHGKGFCLFNNIALATEALRKAGAERVAILDWDAHHGNGTQHSFEGRSDVLYLSSHQYPFFPGTGGLRELGAGSGKGFTVNAPLPPGSGDAEFLAVFDRLFIPILEQYRPDILLVSTGYDGHRKDLLGSMRLSDEAYRVFTRKARAVAEQCCGGKLVATLEGGYDVDALGQGVVGFLEEMLADEVGALDSLSGAKPHAAIEQLIDEIRALHEPYWDL